jgi:hypothetical protein
MQVAKLKEKVKIFPFIDELVDALYTDEINAIINSDNVIQDKRTFMMFITMYFLTRLNVEKNVCKVQIKNFLTDLIRNPEKRIKCIQLFQVFEKSIDSIGTINLIE